ncbi:MAG: deoxyribonuclease IV [Tenericutes bacterium]|jgi:deoxyribonuclease-4|nr:deoxyribonuclease IV [Mycoplasmatota bacterium]
MLIIGSHVSFSKEQLLGCVKEALGYGANTFMFYTGAPQNTMRSIINDNFTLEAMFLMKENNIDYNNVVVHAPYIINLANIKNTDFSISFLTQEINRCEQLGINKLILHPGSHVGIGIEQGIQNIIDCLNIVLKNTNVKILLETMAGKGTEIGSSFEEIKLIIDGVLNKQNIGICLDTCHLNDAGYDISNFDKILDEIDDKIGLSYVNCIHINDSKNEQAAHKDRHDNIGFGTLGFNNIINIIYNQRISHIPKILETPYVEEKPPYKYEILMIKNKKFDQDLKNKIVN